VPKYRVEERVRLEASLGRALAAYRQFPLTQFALVPYAWEYLVFERRPVSAAPSALAPLLRLYNAAWIDVFFHLLVKASVALGGWAVKSFLGLTPALSLRYRRVDDAERVLTLGHHYFRHEEMELFVPESRLAEALQVLRHATEVFAGEQTPPPADIKARLEMHGLYAELLQARGSYVQHYPFSIRRLLAEDALVSMGSSIVEPLFSISVFTYERPAARAAYYRYCAWLARCMLELFGARLHWGKHFPLDPAEAAARYPRIDSFVRVCRMHDPRGVFGIGLTSK
jgi:hypothetical protein